MEVVIGEVIFQCPFPVIKMREEVDEFITVFLCEDPQPIIKKPDPTGVTFRAGKDGLHKHLCFRRDALAAGEDLFVILEDLIIVPVGPPVEVVGADQEKNGRRGIIQDGIQAIEYTSGVISVDTPVLHGQLGEELLPCATIGDTIAKEDNVSFADGCEAEEIGALLVMMVFNAFDSTATDDQED